MTAGSGDLSPRDGSSAEQSPPTGPSTASASSSQSSAGLEMAASSISAARPSARTRRRTRRAGSGQRLFAFDRRLGYRLLAGADEAGRGCLAGTLVAAAVLFDYESLTTRELRSLRTL